MYIEIRLSNNWSDNHAIALKAHLENYYSEIKPDNILVVTEQRYDNYIDADSYKIEETIEDIIADHGQSWGKI